jgi:hypothetical protein
MMSKFEDVATAVIARLTQISIENGYSNNAGSNIFDGNRSISVDRLPAVVLTENEEDVMSLHDDGTCSIRVPYVCEGHILCAADHPNRAARSLARDITRALILPGVYMDDLQAKIAYAGKQILPRDSGSNTIVVQVHFQIVFQIDMRT